MQINMQNDWFLWCALTTKGQTLNAGTAPWWSVRPHRWSATHPEAEFTAGEHRGGGGGSPASMAAQRTPGDVCWLA